jgi:hypothetical protein
MCLITEGRGDGRSWIQPAHQASCFSICLNECASLFIPRLEKTPFLCLKSTVKGTMSEDNSHEFPRHCLLENIYRICPQTVATAEGRRETQGHLIEPEKPYGSCLHSIMSASPQWPQNCVCVADSCTATFGHRDLESWSSEELQLPE